ncbi:hypothetical protein GGS23DRAFT_100994 [Durotheca rogersii]|uniref:uncharacterized protein n=1 Tax=Durotheca rogersii TaxID=419775 RepID=UPI00221FE349|nr:uncharacterized protein GGS23DRAFT_100994 [Durotheca rogersii]KAI5862452.1 hypothetical protein GGS23DRAFT_100994 [Durotheca rogersii]
MSASTSRPLFPSADITCIGSDPFEPLPLIADILRTGYCIPGSVFLVEGVDVVHTSRSKRWRAVRLLLGDGELCIQALLSADMHRYIDSGEVSFGSYVRLEKFRVEWRDAAEGKGNGSSDAKGKEKEKSGGDQDAEGSMVYLVVEDIVLVGWNNTLIDATNLRNGPSGSDRVGEDEATRVSEPENELVPSDRTTIRFSDNDAGPPQNTVDGADDDDFEVMPIAPERTTQNRIDLAVRSGDRIFTGGDTVRPRSPADGGRPSSPHPVASTPRPVKLTKLRAIPNLPYKQNWSVNVLAVVAAVSEVEPSTLPPYSQRQVRLADPSTDKRVLLTVFLEPELFAPAVGSAVLLLGVKNHRFDGGCLKKYASDRSRAPGHTAWWYENPTQFDWCDVEGLRRWWHESQAE